jgi:hypothetical protein
MTTGSRTSASCVRTARQRLTPTAPVAARLFGRSSNAYGAGNPFTPSTEPSATAHANAVRDGTAPGFRARARDASTGLRMRSSFARHARLGSRRPAGVTGSPETRSGSGSAPMSARANSLSGPTVSRVAREAWLLRTQSASPRRRLRRRPSARNGVAVLAASSFTGCGSSRRVFAPRHRKRATAASGPSAPSAPGRPRHPSPGRARRVGRCPVRASP